MGCVGLALNIISATLLHEHHGHDHGGHGHGHSHSRTRDGSHTENDGHDHSHSHVNIEAGSRSVHSLSVDQDDIPLTVGLGYLILTSRVTNTNLAHHIEPTVRSATREQIPRSLASDKAAIRTDGSAASTLAAVYIM